MSERHNSEEAEQIKREAAEECTAQADCVADNNRLELLAAQYAELEERNKRVTAEYQNFRARTQKEKEAAYADSAAAAIASFLPILDSLERGFVQETNEEYSKGIELIIKQYLEILSRYGVTAIGAVGEPFDPSLHNAVMHIEDEALGENAIAEVMLKGYRMGERVLRHAMVKVAN